VAVEPPGGRELGGGLERSGQTGVLALLGSGTSRLQVWRISPGGDTWQIQ